MTRLEALKELARKVEAGALLSVNPHAGTLNISITGMENDE